MHFTEAKTYTHLTGANEDNGASIKEPPFTLFPPVKTGFAIREEAWGVSYNPNFLNST
jgi:hypothetical protein